MVHPQDRRKLPNPKPTVGRAEAERRLLAHLGEAMELISEGGIKSRVRIMEAIEAVSALNSELGTKCFDRPVHIVSDRAMATLDRVLSPLSNDELKAIRDGRTYLWYGHWVEHDHGGGGY
jgi:hypothetical protein